MDHFTNFATTCMEALKAIQDKLHAEYDVNSYENWYYDQHMGLFTFSTGSDQLNFKYINVGSLSEKSNTWMWAWHNESIIAQARKPSETVKKYGKAHGFVQLTNGTFEADEYDAWEFAAIALKLLGGIGIYRPFKNELKSYVILQEVVPNEEAQAIKDRYIECNKHETGRIAFVCRHLNNTDKVGFNEAFDTIEGMELREDDDFQAWCDACEEVRQKQDEWNEVSMAFAQIKLVCETCYFDMKEVNLGYR